MNKNKKTVYTGLPLMMAALPMIGVTVAFIIVLSVTFSGTGGEVAALVLISLMLLCMICVIVYLSETRYVITDKGIAEKTFRKVEFLKWEDVQMGVFGTKKCIYFWKRDVNFDAAKDGFCVPYDPKTLHAIEHLASDLFIKENAKQILEKK